MKIIGKTINFGKKNKGAILAIIALVGFAYTVVKTAQEAPKASQEIEKLEEERGRELTKIEKAKVSLPFFIKPVAAGIATSICIAGSAYYSSKTVNALMAACALSKGLPIDSIAGKEVKLDKSDDTKTFYDLITKQEFQSTTADIQEAFYKINKGIALENFCALKSYLKMLDIPDNTGGYSQVYGWDYDSLIDQGSGGWLDYHLEEFVPENGDTVYILRIDADPDILWGVPVDLRK